MYALIFNIYIYILHLAHDSLYKTCSFKSKSTLEQSSKILNESDESFQIVKSLFRWRRKEEEKSKEGREE